ncbi:MAG: hypothetical protein HGA65_03120, partial [Oscillochloris sp.]|nr:hypothetical protein [Oscillochloris sp.]
MTEPVLDFIVTFIFVIGNAVLATFVALRAWEHRPARVFVIVVALLVTTAISIYGQAIFTSPDTLYLLRSLHIIQVGVVSSAFILLLTAIFMPVWWEGRRPIRWIMLPYLLFSVWLAVDLLAQRGVFVAGLNITETDITFKVTHMGRLLMVAFSLSWLMPLVMLITTFMRDHQARIPILVLGGSIVLSLALNSVRLFLSPSPVLRGMILLTPLPLALAHVVFRTRMITPLRAAIDQAFETMSDVAIVLDTADQISYANGRALDRGFQLHADFATALRSINPALETADTFLTGAASQRLQLSGRQLVVSRSTLVDTHGRRVGTLVLGRDVTEIEERTLQLEQERAHLASLVRELEAEQQERAALAATVQA